MVEVTEKDALFEYEQEVLSYKDCVRINRSVFKDGLGTPGPRALIQNFGSAVSYYGTQRFNGGTVIDGKWYEGYHRPWPKLPDGWRFESHPAWGVFLLRYGETVRQAIFREKFN